ncbi:MAG: hypothetical protein V3U03_02565, partial [Myxococcota bacterium]
RRELQAVTGGVPRLINVICDAALLAGYARERSTLDAALVREVAQDLEFPEGERAPVMRERKKRRFGRSP